MRTSGAIGQALDVAQDYVSRAQAVLAQAPANPYRAALADLAEYFVSRSI